MNAYFVIVFFIILMLIATAIHLYLFEEDGPDA